MQNSKRCLVESLDALEFLQSRQYGNVIFELQQLFVVYKVGELSVQYCGILNKNKDS